MSAGALAQVSIGLESQFGTAVTPSKSISVRPGDGVQTNTNTQAATGVRSVLAKRLDSFKGNQVHEGEYEMELIPGNMGYFLLSALGAVASDTADGETVVYEHIFTEQANKPSLTVEQSISEVCRRFAGAVASGFKFSSKTGEAILFNVPLMAKSNASATAITPANETDRVLNFADILVADGVTIGATAYDEAEEIEIEYENGLTMSHAHGSNDPAFKDAGRSEVKGKLTFYLNTATAALYTSNLNATKQAIVVKATGDAIGSASNFLVEITIPRAVLTVSSIPINDEYNKITVEFEGEYDEATSKLLSARIVNETEEYT